MLEENKKLVRRYYEVVVGDLTGIEIDFLLAEGDRVDCHFVALFKHTGEFAGIAPKGNRLRVPAVSTFRIAGGKLAEAWEIYDSGDMLRQIRA